MAYDYLDYTAFSKPEGRTLQYEGFSRSVADYAVNHIHVAWRKQAVRMAKAYLDYTAFSCSGLIDQLEYEKFTHPLAVYGATTPAPADHHPRRLAARSLPGAGCCLSRGANGLELGQVVAADGSATELPSHPYVRTMSRPWIEMPREQDPSCQGHVDAEPRDSHCLTFTDPRVRTVSGSSPARTRSPGRRFWTP